MAHDDVLIQRTLVRDAAGDLHWARTTLIDRFSHEELDEPATHTALVELAADEDRLLQLIGIGRPPGPEELR